MALEIKHAFASLKGDGPDATQVQPSDWNALHVATLGPGLVGNPTASTGSTVEVPLGAGLTFEDGALVNTVKGVPIGAVIPFAGDFAPPFWLFCFGQEVDRIIFATLFSVIKTLYGAGNGTTTFNVPDLRGRAAAGRDNMGGITANRIKDTVDGKVLGNNIGTERHILLPAEVPTHTHVISTAPDHRHLAVSSQSDNGSITSSKSISHTRSSDYTLSGFDAEPVWGRTGLDGSHNHTTSMPTEYPPGTPITFDQPHLNMQPSIILNYIIWAGAQA